MDWIGRRAQAGAFDPVADLDVFYSSGKRLRDFVWTTAAVPLITERVRDALAEHKLLGWRSYRTRLFDQAGKPVPSYCGLAVVGRCASISFNKRADTVIYRARGTGAPMPCFKDLRFDLATWDGSDFFMGADRKTGWIVVSERVESLFKGLKITNCKFTPVDDVELIAQKSDIEPI